MRFVRVLINDTAYDVEVLDQTRDEVSFLLDGRSYRVEFEKRLPEHRTRAENRTQRLPKASSSSGRSPDAGNCSIVAPIPGVVVEILIAAGGQVTEGDVLMRLEAMKMQNNIFAPISGTVISVHVSQGDEVSDGQLLVEISS